MTYKNIPNTDALEIIEESINAGKTVRLKIRGNSMFPLLMDGVDYVILHPCDPAELRPGDIIFFRYKGLFLLHRIIRVIQSAENPAGQPIGFFSIQPTDRPEDNPAFHHTGQSAGHSAKYSANHTTGQSARQYSNDMASRTSNTPDGDSTGQFIGTFLITTRGDALSKTETITFADVIAIAEVPRHSLIRKAFRRLVNFTRRVRSFFVRRFLGK